MARRHLAIAFVGSRCYGEAPLLSLIARFDPFQFQVNIPACRIQNRIRPGHELVCF